MSETLKEIEQFTIQKLKNLLEQCTNPQKELFFRMYGDVDTMDKEKIPWAIQQCERTIVKNNKVIKAR